MQQHGSKFLHVDTPSTPGMLSKGQNICLSESNRVEYQIKGNTASTYSIHIHTLNPRRSKHLFFLK